MRELRMEGGVQKPLRDGVTMAGSTKPDREQDSDQRAAVAMRRNGAVSAGAGSGKTTVLAARYVDLIVNSGAELRSILTLTFTRKAAAEMYSRIHESLVRSELPAVREQAARFPEASISTIDAFCGTVTRSSAARYGYAPDFTTDDEKARSIAVDEALAYLLENRRDPALMELNARLGFTTAWKELFADLAYSLVSPCPDEDGGFPGIAEKTAAALDGTISGLVAALRELSGTVAGAAAAIGKPGNDCALAIEFFGSLPGRLDELPPTPATAVFRARPANCGAADLLCEIARAAAELALRGYARSDPDQTIVKEAAKNARDLAPRLGAAAALLADLGLLEAVMRHMDAFALRYRAAKRAAGVMGFRDVALCATHLLRTRPDIRSWWKGRYRYIMIDEFQDNNADQKNLLFLLAERPELSSPDIPRAEDLVPDKLFFVGDEKQSIYMFRGADVSVFRRLDRELASDGTSLATNYRSEPVLVDFFNSAFARIMANPEADFEARFSEIKRRPPTPGLSPTIRYLLRQKPGQGRKDPAERSEDEILAHGIARFVRERVERGDLPVADGKGGTRPAGYGDFALLMRSTSNQHLLERFFRILDIPYSASAVCGLFMESPVNDIYNALRLVLLPEDRTAFAAVLRSPLVRVSDDALVAILSSMDRDKPASPGTAFGTASGTGSGFDPGALTAADRERFERGKAIFAKLATMADRVPAPELVSWIWHEAGLRAAILSKPEAHPFLEHFEFVFDLACRAEAAGKNLSAFVSEDLEPFIGSIEKKDVDELQRDHAEGVRIMTVHKSKGLEFPVVIIPWMNNTGARDSSGEAWYASERVGVSVNLKPYDRPKTPFRNIFFEEAKEAQKAKRAAETKRLFYVACTRAIFHLVFAGFDSSRAESGGLSFHSLLAGGDGKRGEDGRFPALEPEVSLETIPGLTTDEYKSLFRGTEARKIDDFAPAYRRAARLDRQYCRTTLSATELEAARSDELAAGKEGEKPSGLGQAGRTGRPAGTAWPAALLSLACPQMPFPPLPYETGEEADEEGKEGTDFGRVCHAVLEARYKGFEAFSLVTESLAGGASLARLAAMKAGALSLAEGFAASELGREIADCPRVETEKDFLLALPGGFLVKGRMDLFARKDGRILIVDFKTHRRAAQGAYALQLWLYRKAAEFLYPDDLIETWLVWLRGPVATCVEAAFTEGELARFAARASDRVPADM